MGDTKPLPERLSPDNESEFPNLVKSGYRVTSHFSDAHAADDQERKWVRRIASVLSRTLRTVCSIKEAAVVKQGAF